MRWWPLLIILLLAAGLAGFGISFAQREPQYRVTSGSMAPVLLGPHYQLKCHRCQFPAILDATQELPSEVTCPNCGYQKNNSVAAIEFLGEELQWEPVRLEELQRWDIVVLEDPRHENRLTVKRVAFLPGERPRIRYGELYAGSQLLRKSPRQREAQKVLVFDQRYDAPEASRFHPARPTGSGWSVRPGSLGFAPITESDPAEEDWLEYHHQACLPPPSPAHQDAVPRDNYAYNHALSRELFPASDLWLEGTIAHWGAQVISLRLQAEQGETTATIRIDLKNRVVRCTAGAEHTTLPLEISSLQGFTFQAGVYDHQTFVQLRHGKRHWYFPLGQGRVTFGKCPLAIRVEGGPAVLQNAQVFRDVVYLGRHQRDDAWSSDTSLGKNEIFVLGDNVPLSDDSRFDLGAVDASRHLRGRVVLKRP